MNAPPPTAPGVVLALLQKAHALMGRGSLEEAETLCRRAVGLAPHSPDAVHLLALLRRRRGDEAGAEPLIRESLALAPHRPDFYANYGNLLGATGRVAEAERSYRYAMQLDPTFRPARLALGRLLTGAGHAAAAEQELRALIAAGSGDGEAWAALGAALAAQERLAEAEAAYRRAIDLAPGLGYARHNLGNLLSRTGRAAEALAAFDEAAARGAGGRPLHLARARALSELGRLDEAEREFGIALASAPGDLETHALLAKLRFMRGDPDFARGLREVIEARPGDARPRLTYATMLREAGEHEAAAAAFEAALTVIGPEPALLGGLALTLRAAGRPTAAVEPARRALAARPDDPALGNALASILLCAGRPDEAWPVIRRLRERDPAALEPIAHEAVAARLLADPGYARLYDFERFVRPYDLEPPAGYASMQEFNAALAELLESRHRFDAHPLDQSLRSGTQTAGNLLGDPHPLIQAFVAAIEAPIADYRAAVGRDPAHPLEARNLGESAIDSGWSVRLRRGGFHVNHIHPAGWLSSAYYVHTPADVADVEAKSGWIKFGEPRFPVPGALPERIIQPRPGRLVLFPSYMWHGTTPITTDEPRLTIAFDVVTKPAN